MRKFATALLIAALAATAGCAVIDYPIVTDSRGDYQGIIRTAHKAYIQQTSQVTTFWPDGSDELFSMVYQNQYGDQTLYTFNNFDPTGDNKFLDQTYCDWNFEGCELVRAWNPRQNDDEFDYELFSECSGARSLTLLVGQSIRLGECGDTFAADRQALLGEFADLDATNWRGGRAYVLPIDSTRFNVNLTSADGVATTMPVFGSSTAFVTDEDLNLAVPMTPNMRHQLSWLRAWAVENGQVAQIDATYGGVSARVTATLRIEGLSQSIDRF